jgi:hypothetical protein
MFAYHITRIIEPGAPAVAGHRSCDRLGIKAPRGLDLTPIVPQCPRDRPRGDLEPPSLQAPS